MSMFKTKKQLPFDPHDALMKEQFYTVYHELKKSDKQVFTVTSTKDRGVVGPLIVNIGLVFAEMKKGITYRCEFFSILNYIYCYKAIIRKQ